MQGLKKGVLACALAMGIAAPLQAADTREAQVSELTALVVKMMPIGPVFEGEAAKDPHWPLNAEQLAKVGEEKLTCLRGELSDAGYRRARAADSRDYVDAHTDRIDADLVMLRQISAVFAQSVEAGMEEARGGKKAAADAIVASNTDAAVQMAEFLTDKDRSDLRAMLGIGDSLLSGDAQKDKKAGEDAGADLVIDLMRRAIDTCQAQAVYES